MRLIIRIGLQPEVPTPPVDLRASGEDSAGRWPTANPTFSAVFPTTFRTSPGCEARQIGGTGTMAFVSGGYAATTTNTGTFTFIGTPVAGQTYIFLGDCRL